MCAASVGGMVALSRPRPTPRELRTDVVLAACLFVAGVISAALTSTAGFYGSDASGMQWALLTVFAATAPLAVRRRFPISVAAVVLTVFFLAVTFSVPEIYVLNIASFIAIYTVGAWVNDRRRAFWSRIVLISLMFVWLLVTMFVTATDPDAAGDFSRAGAFSPFVAFILLQLLINIGFFGGAYYMGDRAYASALEKVELAERRRELEHEREVTAAQAVALDRVAIARELHDVVAHHVSAMGVQAGAARAVLSINPDAAGETLRGIETSARTAIDELHHLLETLRSPGDTSTPAASTLNLDHLPELVDRAVEVGMPTTLTVIGDPEPLPDLVHANLFRIAQEALTNARRHGGPDAAADVRLRYAPTSVELEVANSGRDARSSRAGLGQLGMRERAASMGGTIDLGPRARGGFVVRVSVPVHTATKELR